MMRRRLLLATALALAGCTVDPPPVLDPLPGPLPLTGAAAPRIDGRVGAPSAEPAAQVSLGAAPSIAVRAPGSAGGGGGDISLDFADTDIREVVAQMLGTLLHVTYTIDPAVHGTATLRTATPLNRAQLLPALQAMLAQNGATVIQSDGIYRVVASNPQNPGAALAGSLDSSGSAVVPLRFASAEDLARVLQPFVGQNARVLPDPGRNALLLSGDPGVRASLLELVRAFDVDLLAGQSYALLPSTSGDAKDFAGALQAAFRAQTGGALANLVRVVPMDRMNAVLVIASQPRYIEDARRVYALVERDRRETVRSWHVTYLQNSHANDAAYVLQQAFTPNNVTAQPTQSATQQNAANGGQQLGFSGRGSGSGNSGIGGGSASGGLGGSIGGASAGGLGGGGLSSGGLGGGTSLTAPAATATGGAGSAGAQAGNPLLGGLDQSGGGGSVDTNTMRIIPNPQNNAILVYATGREQDTVEAMLRKIDILPLQVRIDATIAEVTLNDALQYGTQFFFKAGGINGALNNIAQSAGTFGGITSLALGSSFPGFVVGGGGAGGAPFALSLLQGVTTVNVLSSPQILVLDNQPARLQVGNLVPYLTTSSQSTITSGSPVINSIAYQPTGVIMQVTPRVNAGGLVTLDVAQEVSDVSTTATTNGINSPTFLERNVTSRVVVQDGQTIGLAGLIRDSVTRGNTGIPWLKDIPVLGLLAGTQDNQRTRTELLVLITPHVLHDQRDARALTEDLRDQLSNAAALPAELGRLRQSGSTDPNRGVRRGLGLE